MNLLALYFENYLKVSKYGIFSKVGKRPPEVDENIS